jgi:hypothetical protein
MSLAQLNMAMNRAFKKRRQLSLFFFGWGRWGYFEIGLASNM